MRFYEWVLCIYSDLMVWGETRFYILFLKSYFKGFKKRKESRENGARSKLKPEKRQKKRRARDIGVNNFLAKKMEFCVKKKRERERGGKRRG